MAEVIKSLVFLAVYGGILYFVWHATCRIAENKFNRQLDRFAVLSIALPVTGIIGWLIFIIYFYIAIYV